MACLAVTSPPAAVGPRSLHQSLPSRMAARSVKLNLVATAATFWASSRAAGVWESLAVSTDPDHGAPSEGRCYARQPTIVSAKRLDRAHRWQTSTGETLTGTAGDWLVTDASGGQRTVKDGAFRAMHRHIDGDRWERVGSVRARRVQTREEVATLEGVVTALLGDWVLTADAGGSWPVSDDYFSSAYAFGDREPEKSGTS